MGRPIIECGTSSPLTLLVLWDVTGCPLTKVPEPPPLRPRRILSGMKPCGNNCATCPYVVTAKTVKSTYTGNVVPINTAGDCNTKGVIYCVTCDKCQAQYIGQTGRSLNERFSEHIGYVKTHKFNQPTGRHFNSPGHQLSDMKISIVEKVYKNERSFRETRETLRIRDFQTEFKGLNRKA